MTYSSTPASSAFQFIKLTHPADYVWQITLDHHEKRNALSIALLGEIERVLIAAQASDDVRVVVLTGQDGYFCAGADVADMSARGYDGYADPLRLERWKTVETFPKPLSAAVNGYAIGGGNELAMLADIVIAGSTATFSQREIVIGGLPGDGGTQRLPRAIGKSLAMKMILTGEAMSAQDAERHGLVAEVVDPSRTVLRAVELAVVIAARAPLSVQLAKRAVLDAFDTTLSEGKAREREANRAVFATQDREEGHRAFVEKRAPRFVGR
jgi:enoyl-CoA hydratase